MTLSSYRLFFLIPYFVETQRKSFLNLLSNGLIYELSKRNPIIDSEKNLKFVFYPEHYILSLPEYTPKQALLKAKTYGSRLYVPLQLTDYKNKKVKLQWVLIGNLPLMTKRGHFIVNGSPRVIVNQLVRSPGIYYRQKPTKRKKLYSADLIANRGAWLRIETDKKQNMWVKMKKTPKIPLLIFLYAINLTEKIFIQVLEYTYYNYLMNSMKVTDDYEYPSEPKNALLNLYSIAFPRKKQVDPSLDKAKKFLFRKFFNHRTYDLSKVGRMQLNKKFQFFNTVNAYVLTPQDLLFITDYLIKLVYQIGVLDDIDHLKNRRVRTSGELIQNQLATGFIRLEKFIREKIKNSDRSIFHVISTKPVNGALQEFFNSSPLSQFMDQTNPLAELTHKRRVSSLGPGGINRETAGMAIRGIHPTHYGRVCPIETPEGKNAGIVNSLTTFAKVNDQGFIETPFYSVYQGQIQKYNGVNFFSAAQEEHIISAPADLKTDYFNNLPLSKIPVKVNGEFKKLSKNQVEYIAISPIQMISIATSLIPFLEHDDANRALMGSNMQRQAVPLLLPEKPIVGTGLETRIIADSGHGIQAKESGFVSYVSNKNIKIENFFSIQKTKLNNKSEKNFLPYKTFTCNTTKKNIYTILTKKKKYLISVNMKLYKKFLFKNFLYLSDLLITKKFYLFGVAHPVVVGASHQPQLEKNFLKQTWLGFTQISLLQCNFFFAPNFISKKNWLFTNKLNLILNKLKFSGEAKNENFFFSSCSWDEAPTTTGRATPKKKNNKLNLSSELLLLRSNYHYSLKNGEFSFLEDKNLSQSSKFSVGQLTNINKIKVKKKKVLEIQINLNDKNTLILVNYNNFYFFNIKKWKNIYKFLFEFLFLPSKSEMIQTSTNQQKFLRTKNFSQNKNFSGNLKLSVEKTKKFFFKKKFLFECINLLFTQAYYKKKNLKHMFFYKSFAWNTSSLKKYNLIKLNKNSRKFLQKIPYKFTNTISLNFEKFNIFSQNLNLNKQNFYKIKTSRAKLKNKKFLKKLDPINLFELETSLTKKQYSKKIFKLLYSLKNTFLFSEKFSLCNKSASSLFSKNLIPTNNINNTSTKKNKLNLFKSSLNSNAKKLKIKLVKKYKFSPSSNEGTTRLQPESDFLSFNSLEFKQSLNSSKPGHKIKNKNLDYHLSQATFLGSWLKPATGFNKIKTTIYNKKNTIKNFNFYSQFYFLRKNTNYLLQPYQRSNQNTCIYQRPIVNEGEWVQKGDLIADGAVSVQGELSLGKTLLVAYMPWEGYNFEDAILISQRLIYDDLYTSIHIEKYEVEISDTEYGLEQITKNLPTISRKTQFRLDNQGVILLGTFVNPGDILVGKITPIKTKKLSGHEKLLADILGKKKSFTHKDTSLRVPKNVSGIVVHIERLQTENISAKISYQGLGKVVVYIAEKKKIQVGDKMSGRHGNKGIISQIIPQQDMPYLPDGTPVDMVLNPLGVPSRMNVGQIFECILGLAGKQLNEQFKVNCFDEMNGPEASRSLTYSKLFQARLRTNKKWLFDPNFPGKTKLFDGRTGEAFHQPVTVGQPYMLKLVHLVDEKIHARSTGPYSLITQQPLKGRSKNGGQRLGEMEVWALEGFGAAYTLQEILTVKSDDMEGRYQVVQSILEQESIKLGTPESFMVLLSELKALCLNIGIYSMNNFKLRKKINMLDLLN